MTRRIRSLALILSAIVLSALAFGASAAAACPLPGGGGCGSCGT